MNRDQDTTGVAVPHTQTREQIKLEKDARTMSPVYSLTLGGFRILWYGIILSALTNWIRMITLGWLVFDRTGSSSTVGLVSAVQVIPMLVLMPVAGVVLDRVNRRVVILVSQLVLLGSTLTITFALAFDALEIWHLFAFSIVGAAAATFSQPALQTATFDLVPRTALPNALGLNSMGASVTRVLGPAAGGVLLATLGGLGSFSVQTAGVFAVVLTMLRLRLPARGTTAEKKQSPLRDMRDGFAYAVQDRRIATLLLLSLVPPIFLWPYWNSLMPVFARDVLHTGPAGLGLLLAAIGVGGLAGGAIITSMNRFERRGLLQLVGLTIQAAAIVGFSLSYSLPVAVAFLFVGGLAEQFYMVTNQTIIQLLAPDTMRGRIVSLMQMQLVIWPFCALIGGVGADGLGIRTMFIAMTSGGVLLAALFLVRAAPIRHLTLSDLTARSRSAAHP